MTMSEPYPLPRAPLGRKVVVKIIRAGCEFRHRLASMGIRVGIEMEVLQGNGRGPLIVAVKGGRVAVGRGMAEGILVQES